MPCSTRNDNNTIATPRVRLQGSLVVMLVWQEHPSTASAKCPLTGNVTGGGSCGHAIRRSDVWLG